MVILFKTKSKKYILLASSLILVLLGRLVIIANLWSLLEQRTLGFELTLDRFLAPLTFSKSWFESRHALQMELQTSELKLRERDAELAKLKFVESENVDLRASLASPSGIMKDWLVGDLVRGENLFVDLGLSEGVGMGSTVSAHGVYLGSIINPQAHISQIETLETVGSRVGARVETSEEGVIGVITRINSVLVMTCVSRFESVSVGDMVVTLPDTTNKDGGILIGYISEVKTRPADPVSVFVVRPALDLNVLTNVLVRKGSL